MLKGRRRLPASSATAVACACFIHLRPESLVKTGVYLLSLAFCRPPACEQTPSMVDQYRTVPMLAGSCSLAVRFLNTCLH